MWQHRKITRGKKRLQLLANVRNHAAKTDWQCTQEQRCGWTLSGPNTGMQNKAANVVQRKVKAVNKRTDEQKKKKKKKDQYEIKMTALKVWTGTYVMLRTLIEQKPSKKCVASTKGRNYCIHQRLHFRH